MRSYKNLLFRVLDKGALRRDRTGTGTLSLFGASWEHDMERGLPVLTTKQINTRACVQELLWFLRGSTDVRELQAEGVHIWDPWMKEDGTLGPVYGSQWRRSGPRCVDQVAEAERLIREDPWSRRIIIDAWSPSDLPDMALPPCHVLWQFYVRPKQELLDLQVYQRSGDLFLGVPFDILEAGLFLCMMAASTGYMPGVLRFVFGDAHIYQNHLRQVNEQLTREPYRLPRLSLHPRSSVLGYTAGDIEIINYKHHPAIKADVAV